MPFTQFIPRTFNSDGVRTYAPVAPGVYGISNAREWIYIGETDNIQGALLTHLGESSTALMQHGPTGFVFEICDRAKGPGRQDRLVTEYQPSCNRQSLRSR